MEPVEVNICGMGNIWLKPLTALELHHVELESSKAKYPEIVYLIAASQCNENGARVNAFRIIEGGVACAEEELERLCELPANQASEIARCISHLSGSSRSFEEMLADAKKKSD